MVTPNQSTKRKRNHDMEEDVAVESLEDVQIDNEYDKFDSDSEIDAFDNGNSDDEVVNVHKNKANYESDDDSTDDNDAKDEEDDRSYSEISSEELDESGGHSILEGALRSQKRSTIKQDGDIKITPFNIREELEEGQFDSEGNYIFAKPKRLDNWEKSIDWDKIEKDQNELTAGPSGSRSATNQKTKSQEPSLLSKLDCYKQMLRIMRHEETVQKCIRRLGISIPKRRPIKSKTQPKDDKSSHPKDEDRESEIRDARLKMDRICDLANQQVQQGDLDIYSRTYEELEDAINQ